MGPIVDVVPSSADFPRRAEVVVIGGGIVGIATALALVRQGVQTVLLERAALPLSSPVVIGAGVVVPGAISANCR